jgi:regulator of protease activity HflC (stomatin/prohibitin superfamily)
MDPSYRRVLAGLSGFALVSIVLFPHALGAILIVWLVAMVASWPACMRSVPEPQRAIVMRGGVMHHLGASGLVCVIPLIESLGKRVEMSPHSQSFVVHQIAANDGKSIYMNLELTWRLRPDITMIDDALRQTLLKTDEQQRAMIEQNVSVIAREIVLLFAPDQLKRADTRESIAEIMRAAVNDLLRPHGLEIETIFWRGSLTSSKVIEERQAIAISQERVEALIREIKLLQEQLPGMPVEQLLIYQAWVDLLRRGIAPPAPPGYFHMPSPPQKD